MDSAHVLASLDLALQQLSHPGASLVPAVATARAAAQTLDLRSEMNWLDLKLRGYADPGSSGTSFLGEVLGVDQSSDLPGRVARCRTLEGEIYLQFNFGGGVESLPYPYFAIQSVGDIEALIARGAGRPKLTVGWDALPPIFHEMFTRFGVKNTRDFHLEVFFTSHAFATMHAAIKSEIAGFLAKARVMLRPRAPAAAASATSFTVGNVSGNHVVIVQAAPSATVTISQGPLVEPTTDTIATLLEESREFRIS